MRWSRAVDHLAGLAESCDRLATDPVASGSFRVVQLWALGDLLGPPRELDRIAVALCVDLPVESVPWLSEPQGARWWADMTRMSKNPVVRYWRSVHAPVWNHLVERPAPVWDVDGGTRAEVVQAIQEGRGEDVRSAAPSRAEYVERVRAEYDVSLAALRGQSARYDELRWGRQRLEPLADDLALATRGYLDVLDAVGRLDGR